MPFLSVSLRDFPFCEISTWNLVDMSQWAESALDPAPKSTEAQHDTKPHFLSFHPVWIVFQSSLWSPPFNFQPVEAAAGDDDGAPGPPHVPAGVSAGGRPGVPHRQGVRHRGLHAAAAADRVQDAGAAGRGGGGRGDPPRHPAGAPCPPRLGRPTGGIAP